MSYKDAYAEQIERYFYDLENRIIADIVRRIRKIGEITSTADYQIGRLAVLGYSSADIEDAIKSALGATYPQMFELYDKVACWEYVRNKKLYEQINAEFIPFEDNAWLQNLLRAVKQQTKGTLQNFAQTMGVVDTVNGQMTFLPLTQFYQKTLDAAVLDIASGAFDYNSVLKRTVATLSKSGIRTIDYASGYTSRLPVAVRRAVMTGVSQLTGEISEYNAEKLGTDHFEIDRHDGARLSHRPWQGKVWSKDELVSVCGLGTVTGLKGANCYHEYYPFILGVSERNYTDEELKRLDALEDEKKPFKGKEYNSYEARQKQRQMETAMRAQRTKVRALEEGGADRNDIIIAKARYQGQLAEYKRFSSAMELKPHMERVYIDGLGRVAPGQKTIIKRISAPTIKDTVLAKDGEALQKVLKNSTGEARHVNKMLLYAESTEYVESKSLKTAFAYNPKRDIIEYNTKHKFYSKYDLNFAQAHELSHRMDILEYHAGKSKAFNRAIDEATEYVSTHQNELQKLFLSTGTYYNDFAFSDIVSALSRGKIFTPVGHDNWTDELVKLEVFANISSIDVLGYSSKAHPLIRILLQGYREVVK